jgi:hypothetical protein
VVIVAALAAVVAVACEQDDNAARGNVPVPTATTATTSPVTSTFPTNSTTATASTNARPTTATEPSTTSSVPPIAAGDPARRWCDRTGTERLGTVVNPAVVEASGIVASRTTPGVFWLHNDGDDARVFAVDASGRTLATYDVGADVSDLEDIAIWAGPDGDELLLADIGDNGARRDRVRIVRFAEPDPSESGSIEAFTIDEFRYPDRPHNAEALLVDDRNDRIVIVTKEQARSNGAIDPLGATLPSFVFEGALGGDGVTELDASGQIDTPLLESLTVIVEPHPATGLGFGGVPTGGDVSADGSLVALRTYETAWLWDRGAGDSVAEALATTPCQLTTVLESQGEAIAFDTDSLVTIGEGEQRSLHRLAVAP